jgi:Predicted hydrolases of HD superfamily
MRYDFFSYIDRLKYIGRWNLMRSIRPENVLEHTAETAQIAHALALINNRIFKGNADPGKAAALALFHETGEVMTGDLPTPVKYFNAEISSAYSSIEKAANEKLLSMLPSELKEDYRSLLEPDRTSYEYKLVKAADKLSAYIKCVEELKGGNKEFLKAEKSTKEKLDSLDLPEVEYFMENFVRSYSLTLDELE